MRSRLILAAALAVSSLSCLPALSAEDLGAWTVEPDGFTKVGEVTMDYMAAGLVTGKKDPGESNDAYRVRKLQVKLNSRSMRASDPVLVPVPLDMPHANEEGYCRSKHDKVKGGFQFSCRTRGIGILNSMAVVIGPGVYAIYSGTSTGKSPGTGNEDELKIGMVGNPGKLFGRSNTWAGFLPVPANVANANGNRWKAFFVFKPQWPYGVFDSVEGGMPYRSAENRQVQMPAKRYYMLGSVQEVWISEGTDLPSTRAAEVLAKFDVHGRLLARHPEWDRLLSAMLPPQ